MWDFRKGLPLAAALAAFGVSAVWGVRARAERPNPLAVSIQQIISRPVFRHGTFGIEVFSLDTNKPVYQLNAEKLFTPASTTKLLTEGTALELLGAGYRFHTPVYRTGPIGPDGTLRGDLVLVASGDPDISQRIQPGDTLAFENDDHCYGGPPVPGDPLTVIRQLARQIAAHGIKNVDGRVLVDISLYPEGAREEGTGTVISPMILNDNIVDVTASPGPSLGSPVVLGVSPETSYVRFINHATTGPANSQPDVEWSGDVMNPDGSRDVTVTGTLPLGGSLARIPYSVPQPSRFAEMALADCLQAEGVTVSGTGAAAPNFKALSAYYTPGNLVAEHVSPPLSQDVQITLKVSQNLHAGVMPYIIGAVLGHALTNVDQAGFDLERDFLAKAGLDVSGASQSDGAGGSRAAFYTPDFMVHYLAYMFHQKIYPQLFAGLPILGRDGTLVDIQIHSTAAGHVFAKTGTYDAEDLLNRDDMVIGKGLAGYMTTPDGRHLAFAAYANNVSVPDTDGSVDKIVGEALGEIAAAVYNSPRESPESP